MQCLQVTYNACCPSEKLEEVKKEIAQQLEDTQSNLNVVYFICQDKLNILTTANDDDLEDLKDIVNEKIKYKKGISNTIDIIDIEKAFKTKEISYRWKALILIGFLLLILIDAGIITISYSIFIPAILVLSIGMMAYLLYKKYTSSKVDYEENMRFCFSILCLLITISHGFTFLISGAKILHPFLDEVFLLLGMSNLAKYLKQYYSNKASKELEKNYQSLKAKYSYQFASDDLESDSDKIFFLKNENKTKFKLKVGDLVPTDVKIIDSDYTNILADSSAVNGDNHNIANFERGGSENNILTAGMKIEQIKSKNDFIWVKAVDPNTMHNYVTSQLAAQLEMANTLNTDEKSDATVEHYLNLWKKGTLTSTFIIGAALISLAAVGFIGWPALLIWGSSLIIFLCVCSLSMYWAADNKVLREYEKQGVSIKNKNILMRGNKKDSKEDKENVFFIDKTGTLCDPKITLTENKDDVNNLESLQIFKQMQESMTEVNKDNIYANQLIALIETKIQNARTDENIYNLEIHNKQNKLIKVEHKNKIYLFGQKQYVLTELKNKNIPQPTINEDTDIIAVEVNQTQSGVNQVETLQFKVQDKLKEGALKFLENNNAFVITGSSKKRTEEFHHNCNIPKKTICICECSREQKGEIINIYTQLRNSKKKIPKPDNNKVITAQEFIKKFEHLTKCSNNKEEDKYQNNNSLDTETDDRNENMFNEQELTGFFTPSICTARITETAENKCRSLMIGDNNNDTRAMFNADYSFYIGGAADGDLITADVVLEPLPNLWDNIDKLIKEDDIIYSNRKNMINLIFGTTLLIFLTGIVVIPALYVAPFVSIALLSTEAACILQLTLSANLLLYLSSFKKAARLLHVSSLIFGISIILQSIIFGFSGFIPLLASGAIGLTSSNILAVTLGACLCASQIGIAVVAVALALYIGYSMYKKHKEKLNKPTNNTMLSSVGQTSSSSLNNYQRLTQ